MRQILVHNTRTFKRNLHVQFQLTLTSKLLTVSLKDPGQTRCPMREFLVVPTPWSLEASMNEHVYILPSMPVFVQFGFPSRMPNLHETNTTYTCIFVKTS